MHVYICPYCDPCPKSKLKIQKDDRHKCKYDKEEVCSEEHKCKDIMVCTKCKSEFKITPTFLKEQKRKIKDG